MNGRNVQSLSVQYNVRVSNPISNDALWRCVMQFCKPTLNGAVLNNECKLDTFNANFNRWKWFEFNFREGPIKNFKCDAGIRSKLLTKSSRCHSEQVLNNSFSVYTSTE